MDKRYYEKTKYPNIYKHKKKGTYIVDMTVGYDHDGNRVRTTVKDFTTEKEALKFQAKSKLNHNVAIKKRNNFTIEEGYKKYRDYCINVKHHEYKTMKKKDYSFNNHIIPNFGNRIVQKCDKETAIELHKYLDTTNLSSRTKNDIHKHLSAFFNWCVKEEYMNSNPCSKVDNYKYEKGNYNIIDSEQFKTIINYINKKIDTFKENKNESIIKQLQILFMCRTVLILTFIGSLRLEEFLGLKIKNINNIVKINSAIVFQTGKGYIEKTTKTDKIRELLFSDNILSYINEYKNFMEENYMFHYDQNDYLFINPDTKKVFSENTIRKHVYKLLDDSIGFHVKLHELRHSSATEMYNSGNFEEYDISKWLGHSSVNTTREIYVHFTNKRKQRFETYMDNIFDDKK